MIVSDLVTPFAAFAARAAPDDLVGGWQREIVQPNSEIFASVAPWIDATEAETRLPDLVDRRTELVAKVEQAVGALQQAETVLTNAVGTDRPIKAIVLVGLGQANGWVAPIDGEPTLFVAAERLPDPPFDVVLALHEMVHLVHQRRSARDWPHDRVDVDLFREGLAVHATTRLMPSVSPSGHLWFRPGEEAWIKRCAGAESMLRARALRELDRTDVSDPWFSGAADRATELPGRCGYWLGWTLLDQLVGAGPLDTALDWSLTQASTQLRKALSG